MCIGPQSLSTLHYSLGYAPVINNNVFPHLYYNMDTLCHGRKRFPLNRKTSQAKLVKFLDFLWFLDCDIYCEIYQSRDLTSK